ncbi:basic helix-loop-helix (bHLH) DNA-binding superfamily [Zostera marina]|uniref:Basic helix-loop-helix (BHLH) DNA-binding superfamily n=1 Tax=Zostera marina TaxID=29655 RepID=A0A0K9NP70_ZOSMR|nr:basic helix-loop-helix (bHLH) DNA-binding superfamily [Zostera marina]
MTLETLSSSEISNFLIYDTVATTALPDSYYLHPSTFNFVVDDDDLCGGDLVHAGEDASERKKRRRRTRTSKNKEEAENQRMTHIAVERNRRRQMNEHLSVLRSLMPDSYVQRGDQASIVGGAIDFVKELEQLLQSLETQKRRLREVTNNERRRPTTTTADGDSPPFSQFFTYPQYTWCQAPRENETAENHNRLHRATTTSTADIEVTIIEKHTNLRILTHKRPGHLLKIVGGLEALQLTILHLNATTLDPMALYSISAKVEEGCNLTTVDDIAASVHRMLSQIEDEATATAAAAATN